MDPADLEQLLDRELKQLPRPGAPPTLLPRVMAATVRRGEPVPLATGWSTWSAGWQVATVGIFLVLVAALSWLLAAPPAPVTGLARTAGETAAVLRLFWDVLLQPVATYIFVLGLSLALACAAAWAALEFALGGATQQ
jgi:hypothetical protein